MNAGFKNKLACFLRFLGYVFPDIYLDFLFTSSFLSLSANSAFFFNFSSMWSVILVNQLWESTHLQPLHTLLQAPCSLLLLGSVKSLLASAAICFSVLSALRSIRYLSTFYCFLLHRCLKRTDLVFWHWFWCFDFIHLYFGICDMLSFGFIVNAVRKFWVLLSRFSVF